MEETETDIKRPAKRQKKSKKDTNEQGEEEETIFTKVFEAQTTCGLNRLRCSKNCADKIDTYRQKKIFSTFNALTWSEQTLEIRKLVKRLKISSSTLANNPIIPLKERKFNFKYSLIDGDGIVQEVCRKFFIKCLKVTPSRVDRAMSTLESNPDAVDSRGRAESKNKTPDELINNVKKFIELFPTYESNFNRSCTDKKFMHPHLNSVKLYDEYKRKCEQNQQKFVTFSMFRVIFDSNFNLKFKQKSKGICKTCNRNACLQGMGSSLSENERVDVQNRVDQHKEQVEKRNAEFSKDVQMACASEKSSLVLTFDLQRPFETPSLDSSVVFYKRPLWTHNLCIYDEVARQAYMYVWNESIASRRATEIGSCILYHLKHYIPSTIENIILYSNSYGHQNGNIKVALMLKHFLLSSPTPLKTIKQKFFISGHSYSSCDRNFLLIDREKKLHKVVATPNDWFDIICSAKRNKIFITTKMKTSDFITSKSWDKRFTANSKKSNKNENCFDWSKVCEISQCLEKPLNLNFICTNESTKEIDLKDRNMCEADFNRRSTECLYPLGRAISKAKYLDLVQLKSYLPAKSWEFYDNLRHDATIDKDYGLASDSSDTEC